MDEQPQEEQPQPEAPATEPVKEDTRKRVGVFCPHDGAEMVEGDGKYVCPNAGCPGWAPYPKPEPTAEEIAAQKKAEEEAAARQKEDIEG